MNHLKKFILTLEPIPACQCDAEDRLRRLLGRAKKMGLQCVQVQRIRVSDRQQEVPLAEVTR